MSLNSRLESKNEEEKSPASIGSADHYEADMLACPAIHTAAVGAMLSFTLVTGPRRSSSLKLSDTRVNEPQIRGAQCTKLRNWSHVSPHDDRLREGCRESRRCSRDTYPESYITKYTSIRRVKASMLGGGGHISAVSASIVITLAG